jgi:hypothetical protein
MEYKYDVVAVDGMWDAALYRLCEPFRWNKKGQLKLKGVRNMSCLTDLKLKKEIYNEHKSRK